MIHSGLEQRIQQLEEQVGIRKKENLRESSEIVADTRVRCYLTKSGNYALVLTDFKTKYNEDSWVIIGYGDGDYVSDTVNSKSNNYKNTFYSEIEFQEIPKTERTEIRKELSKVRIEYLRYMKHNLG